MCIDTEKRRLRLKYRKIRNELSCAYKEKAEKLLLKSFIDNIDIKVRLSIAGYMPIDNEINVTPIMKYLENKGNELSFPVIDKEAKTLIFCDQINYKKIIPNIVIVPLIAFDKNLNRLGFGGGYYDKSISYLRNKNCQFIGVGYEKQFCDKIPTTSFDQVLDIIITEKYVRKLPIIR